MKEEDYKYYLIGDNEDDYFNTLFRVGNNEYQKYTYNYGREDSGHWEDDNDLKDIFLNNKSNIKSITYKEMQSKQMIIDDDAYEEFHTHSYEKVDENGNTHVDYIYFDYRVQYDIDKDGNITNVIKSE
ncbi:MAG: hypothetical protein PHX40_02710 [Bacilli bacterium]|nr:hypothetical protein [Bacilli bacterium]